MEEVYNLLKNRKIDLKKLLEYGFVKKGNQYEYKTTLIQDEFDIILIFDKDGKLDFKVIDLISNDEYLLAKVAEATGEFVGKVRENSKNIMIDVITKCSEIEIFKSKQAKEVIEYIKNKYDDEFEFLWEKSNNAIVRHKENNKWYAAILTVSKNKIGIDSNEVVDIIDLKMLPEDIEEIVDNENYFLGYHMNKKHWITIILDGRVEIEEIYEFIDMSYHLK